MFQSVIFLVSVLRMVPLSVLLPGIDGTWVARFIQTITG
jgi:hypothetical protein